MFPSSCLKKQMSLTVTLPLVITTDHVFTYYRYLIEMNVKCTSWWEHFLVDEHIRLKNYMYCLIYKNSIDLFHAVNDDVHMSKFFRFYMIFYCDMIWLFVYFIQFLMITLLRFTPIRILWYKENFKMILSFYFIIFLW